MNTEADLTRYRQRCINTGEHGKTIIVNGSGIELCSICCLVIHWKQAIDDENLQDHFNENR